MLWPDLQQLEFSGNWVAAHRCGSNGATQAFSCSRDSSSMAPMKSTWLSRHRSGGNFIDIGFDDGRLPKRLRFLR